MVVGIAFAVAATQYQLGSALRMGPGYLPLVLGAVLAGLGLVIVGQGVAARVRTSSSRDPAREPTTGSARQDPDPATASGPELGAGTAVASDPESPVATAPRTDTAPRPELERGPVPWARAGLLAAAVLLFGLTVDGAGLVLALFLTAFLAGLAGRGTGPVRAVLIAAALTVLCVLVFVFGLQLRLPLLGTWFR